MIRFAFLALCVGCSQAGPTIVPEVQDVGTAATAPAEVPAPGPPSVDSKAPALPDGTLMFDPPLPPGMAPDPNLVTIQGLYRKHCGKCHGESGSGTGDVPNFVETPQLLNNDPLAIKKKLLTGHGKAPSMSGVIKDEHLGPVVEYLRSRVGVQRVVREAQAPKP